MNPEVDLALLQTASNILTQQGIRHVLIGSAGLKLRGMLPKGYQPQDADFLVTKAPYVKEPLPKEDCSQSDSVAVKIGGVKVDFIVTNWRSNNSRMRKHFTKNPIIVNGVPVADIEDMLALKATAARTKDFAFLADWTREFGEIPMKTPKKFWLF
jgi:predicted nucleotidyltransferase